MFNNITTLGTNSEFPSCLLLFKGEEISHIIRMDGVQFVEIEDKTNDHYD